MVFERPFVKRFALCYRTVVCLSVLSCPVCNLGVLWPNSLTVQDETWHASRPRPWLHSVRWGPSFPPRGIDPNFWPISVAAKWLRRSIYHLVWRWASAQATLCQMQTPLPSLKRGEAPQIFDPCLLWPNGWMDQDDIWHGDRPQPRRLCVKWGPSPPPKFSAHVYYSYCDFVRTLHRRKVLLVCSSSS